MRAHAKFTKFSICSCGFPILSTSIPLGTVYVVQPDRVRMETMRCGGCEKEITGIWVYVEARDSSPAGFLPVEIFEIDEGIR